MRQTHFFIISQLFSQLFRDFLKKILKIEKQETRSFILGNYFFKKKKDFSQLLKSPPNQLKMNQENE